VTELEQRIDATARLLLAAAKEASAIVSFDGRVTEEVAARMLGVSPRTMADWRTDVSGPPHYKHGRISYRVSEIAAFIEGGRLQR